MKEVARKHRINFQLVRSLVAESKENPEKMLNSDRMQSEKENKIKAIRSAAHKCLKFENAITNS